MRFNLFIQRKLCIFFNLIVLFVFLSLSSQAQSQIEIKNGATISGKVTDNWTGEPLYSVNVYAPSLGIGTTTDFDGSYKLTLPKGTFQIVYSRVDLEKKFFVIDIVEDIERNIGLISKITNLEAVVVLAEEDVANVKSLDIGKNEINIVQLKKLPSFMGEADIVKSMTLLPGVSTVGEGASGFNVRGGGVDQNLVLQDGAVIFNPSHVFGFFSVFNPLIVNSGDLYKSGFSAKYGGRLSSVLDVSLKNGNYRDYSVEANIGLVTSNLAFDGPIIKDKLSIVAASRLSYGDWMLKIAGNDDDGNSTAGFMDYNLKLSYLIDEKNQLNYSGYYSSDEFSFGSTALYNWQTLNNVIHWYHGFSETAYLNTYLVNSKYQYGINDEELDNGFDINADIKYTSIKSILNYDISDKHKLTGGIESILYDFNPGVQTPQGANSTIERQELEQDQAFEFSLFLEDEFVISPKFSIRAGLRATSFINFGPGTDYLYGAQDSRNNENIIDTVYYENNEIIATYNGLDPRVAINYSLSESTSIKASYTKTRQFLHLISNTSAVVPTDSWKTSNKYILPETADQFSIGLFKNFARNTIETSIETYYKKTNNIVDFKDGASLLMNDNIEADLISGTGEAYGIEFFLNKKKGPLTGWLNYTYSRTFRTVKGEYEDEIINFGDKYPANFDKPHDFTCAINYESTPILEWGMNFTYSTGRPVTEPTTLYLLSGNPDLFSFSSRNEGRIPDYYRLDASVTFHSKPILDRKWKLSWTLSVYNLLGRQNAYSIFYQNQIGSPPSAYRLSVLGSPYPSLSVNFKI